MTVTTGEWVDVERRIFSKYFNCPDDDANTLSCAKEFTSAYNYLIKSVVKETIQDLKGIGVFTFGSPSRYEMLGQSDLDLMIIRKDDVDVGTLRVKLLDNFKKFNFSKLDIPEWGSLSECKKYLSTAITEGNQVVEARFLTGDPIIEKELNKMKVRYCTPERFRATFCFQYLYFQQYYQQRIRDNQINLKYGHGGTRDFLFPVWLANLREERGYFETEVPAILQGIRSLVNRKNISHSESEEYVFAVNAVALMRNELLRISKGTEDSGLTYLSSVTAKNLCACEKNIYTTPESVFKKGFWATRKVKELKEMCHKVFLNEPGVKEHIGLGVKPSLDNELGSIILSWNLDLSKANKKIVNGLSNSSSWAVLTSLACNPTCTSDVLNNLSNSGMVSGYEYVLKVVARNPNASLKTLEKIASSEVEERFREPAITRLEKGWKKANESQ